MSESIGSPNAVLEASVSEARESLVELGHVAASSGTLRRHDAVLAVHSDYGPPGQDKRENQDYAVALCAGERVANNTIDWAVAIADGVTSSFRSEWGAQIACWCALKRLTAGRRASGPEDTARSCMDAAGAALGTLADQLARGGDAYRPRDEYPATWRLRLRRGQLLQTTLTLAWLEEGMLNVAMIGDGGGIVRILGDERREDKVLAAGEPEVAHVHALGPANTQVEALDLWLQTRLECGGTIALYTDGIRAGLGHHPGRLFDGLVGLLHPDGEENRAESLVHDFVSNRPDDFNDNLTLFVAAQGSQD